MPIMNETIRSIDDFKPRTKKGALKYQGVPLKMIPSSRLQSDGNRQEEDSLIDANLIREMIAYQQVPSPISPRQINTDASPGMTTVDHKQMVKKMVKQEVNKLIKKSILDSFEPSAERKIEDLESEFGSDMDLSNRALTEMIK